jgi:hypothetical protein
LFEADDGSLPEFVIAGLDDTALVAAYNRLSADSRVVNSTQTVHRRLDGVDVLLQGLNDPVGSVVRGEVEPFHVVFGGIAVYSTRLPDIGVGVFPGELILDYRMGPGWTPQAVEAFLHLLSELARTSPTARVGLEDHVPRFWVERFEHAWVEIELGHGAT